MSDDSGRDVGASRAARGAHANMRNESSFTSFSDLGAAIPSSEGESNNMALSQYTSDTGSTSLLTLSGIKTLLHPSSTVATAERSSDAVGLTEETPLLRAAHRQKQRKNRESRCYVGGRDGFGETETMAASPPSDPGERRPVAVVCNQCEEGEKPVSAITLGVISQVLFAFMSLLAEVLAREETDDRMNQMHVMAIQSTAMWILSLAVLVATGTRDAFLGGSRLRGWIWGRAVCAALSTLLYAVAAQALPIMNLVTIVYLAPIAFNLFSVVLLSSAFPFRAQVVTVSLLLGLALLIQPTLLFPDNEDYQTVPASPLDLPPVVDYSLDLSVGWAYAAACSSALFMVLSFGLLGRSSQISIYHSVASNSLLTSLASIALLFAPWTFQDRGSNDEPSSTPPLFTLIPPLKHCLLLVLIIALSFAANLFQALALQRKSARLFSLVTFLQPIFSTGLQTAILDRTIDVLPLAGSVLIAANVAWMAGPLPDEEEEEGEW